MSDNLKVAKQAAIILFTFIAAVVAGLFLPNRCSASLYCPSSYAILSADQQFLLVMRSPVKIENDRDHFFRLPSGQNIDLRDKFHTNGIFRLDTLQCVQPLDWFADDGELFASGDFKLLVRLNRFAIESQKHEPWRWCLKFYNNGKEVKHYQVQDLVEIPNFFFLPQTSYGWHSVWFATAMYTDFSEFVNIQVSASSYNQFILVTAPQFLGRFHLSDGNVFLFNANNGEIKQEWHHYPWIKLSLIIIGFLTVMALLFTMLFRAIRKLYRWVKQKRLHTQIMVPH